MRHRLALPLLLTAFAGCECTSDLLSGTTETPELLDVTTSDGEHCHAVGDSGRIFSGKCSDFSRPLASDRLGKGAITAIHDDGQSYVAAGELGYVYWSADSFNWTWHDLQTQFGAGTLYGVMSCGGELYVVGRAGMVFTSTDGTNWSRVTGSFDANDTLVDVACDAQHVVIVSSDGQAIYVGAPGGTFTRIGNMGTSCAVAAGAGKFVQARVDGTIQTSADGSTWTVAASAVFAASDGCALAFGNGTFALVLKTGELFVSADGTSWKKVEYGEVTSLTGVTIGPGGQLVAVGPKGVAVDAKCQSGSCSDIHRRDVKVRPEGEASTDAGTGTEPNACEPCHEGTRCPACGNLWPCGTRNCCADDEVCQSGQCTKGSTGHLGPMVVDCSMSPNLTVQCPQFPGGCCPKCMTCNADSTCSLPQ